MPTSRTSLDKQTQLSDLLSRNKTGIFFGVNQETLNKVWGALTAENGNSITYVSMEIGSENDVYNPVKKRVHELNVSSKDPKLKYFTNKFIHGPGKIPNYSGGLGVLAGDTLKSFSDCHIPSMAISLLYRKGYFSQLVDSHAGQIAHSTPWQPEETPNLYLLNNPETPDIPLQIEIPFFERKDKISLAYANVWLKMEVNDTLDFFVPEILLDYSVSASPDWIRRASEHLYESRTERAKIIQRRLLGASVIPVMEALGVTSQTIHLNEQHGVVVVLHLIADHLKKALGSDYPLTASDTDIKKAAKAAANRVVYTIHTPVKAGHDRFSRDLYAEFGHSFCHRVLALLAEDEDNPAYFNFTNLAMTVNRTTNGVSRIHRKVTQKQFPKYAKKIQAVTNGVHHLTWISEAKSKLYDSFPEFKRWRHDPGVFSKALTLKNNKHFIAHLEQAWLADTENLINYINTMLVLHRNQMHETWIDPPNYLSHLDNDCGTLDPYVYTVGFARRFSTYKRADLIFDNIDTLAAILVKHNTPVNFIFAGKAHPSDEPGKHMIKLLIDTQKSLYEKSNGLAKLIFIPGYDMGIAKMMVAGVHAWLNTPKRPLEASGTSGMKAAMNAIPNISTLDGWWVEGYHRGKTGWKFGTETKVSSSSLSEDHANLLYHEDSISFYKLFPKILKSFYDKEQRNKYIEKCIMNIALNCPIFNTHRLAAEYAALYGTKMPVHTQKRLLALASLYNSNAE